MAKTKYDILNGVYLIKYSLWLIMNMYTYLQSTWTRIEKNVAWTVNELVCINYIINTLQSLIIHYVYINYTEISL